MGLITASPEWAYCTTNITGTPAATPGTNYTANANDADGSSVAVLTNVSHDIEYLQIGFHATSLSGANTSALTDILIDPAGGTTWASAPLINDLLTGFLSSAATSLVGGSKWYHFPIFVKAGSSLGVRSRTAHTANITSGRVIMIAYGGNANPGSWWCGQSVTTIGVDDTISQGTNHTPGNSGAFSTWADLGSTLPQACGALQYGVHGTNTDTTTAALQYYFEFGAGSTRIGPPIYRTTNTAEAGAATPTGPIFASLPSGTQLQVRATCSGTAEIIDVAAYAVS